MKTRNDSIRWQRGRLALTIAGAAAALVLTACAPLKGALPQQPPPAPPASDLEADSSPVDWGDVANNTTVEKTVTLTNNGNAPTGNLDGGFIQLSGDSDLWFFDVNTCGTVLDPGESCFFELLFHPTSTGMKLAEVIVSDDGPGPNLSIILKGTGV